MDLVKGIVSSGRKMVKEMSSDQGDSSMTRSSSFRGQGQTFLHGYLVIEVLEARDIKDMESWISKMVDKNDVTDAFVDVKLGNSNLAKTAIIDNNLNPVWNESFKVEVCHKADYLLFDVKDKDHAQAEQVGVVEISTQMLLNGHKIQDWFPIKKSNKVNGHLHIGVQFQSMAMIQKTFEVQSYFPMHRGCGVTLYQDAHCPPDIPHLNMVRGPNNKENRPQSCWKDMYYFIEGAQHICCLTGWAIWTKLQLFRGDEAQSIYNGTLGELLLKKANEGVKVQVMIWSEKSSNALKEEGVMGTHDMETYNYFKNARYETSNKVLCALTPRELCGKKELSDMYANEFNSAMYTHHQKSVIVDAPCSFQPDGRRKLVAFVGGLDLNGGRYDNPHYSAPFSPTTMETSGTPTTRPRTPPSGPGNPSTTSTAGWRDPSRWTWSAGSGRPPRRATRPQSTSSS